MKTAIIIPARYDSKRLPGKPLLLVNGKPMIQRVVEQCLQVGSAHAVYVATDNEEIKKVADDVGAIGVMTDPGHKTGTDRVAEVARTYKYDDYDIVINVQGDMPFVNPSLISLVAIRVKVATVYDRDSAYSITTPVRFRYDNENARDESAVKVIETIDNSLKVSYSFSRTDDRSDKVGKWLQHVGMYAFKNKDLQYFARQEQSENEIKYCLEQYRAIDCGMTVKVVKTDHDCGREINTPEDLELVMKDLVMAAN